MYSHAGAWERGKYTFWFHYAVLFLSPLFQDYHISACNSKYSFFLHCGDDYCAEALRGHGGLDDVGVLPAGFVQNPEVVVYQDCADAGFFCRWFILKIPPARLA